MRACPQGQALFLHLDAVELVKREGENQFLGDGRRRRLLAVSRSEGLLEQRVVVTANENGITGGK